MLLHKFKNLLFYDKFMIDIFCKKEFKKHFESVDYCLIVYITVSLN